MPITKGQGQSDMTPFKQQDLGEFLEFWFPLAKNALRNNPRKFRRTITYIDTNAGSGDNPKHKCPGSPLIFCKQAEKEGVLYHAYLVEQDPDACQELKERVKGYDAEVICGNNQQIVPTLLDNLYPGSLGLIYIDPNGIPDWELIRQASIHPKMASIDILVRYNTGAVWRNHHNGYHLNSDIDNLQKRFKWGKDYYPFDRWHWSFLLGMNFEFGDWKKKGWYRLDTQAGQELKEKLADSPTQRQKKSQIALTGLMESTCNTPSFELSERKPFKGLKAYVKDAISAQLRKCIT